ncbi:MAG: PQQ-binding-like beta-propeller repeat protein [Bacteroidota bacterium]
MKKLALLIIPLLLVSCKSKKQEIFEWRGDDRSGIFSETGLMKQWPEDGPELLWTAEGVGNGYGSPLVTSDRIFINGETDSTGYLVAFDPEGKLLWKSSYGPEYTVSFQGSRSTPTYVDGKLYVCSGEGRITCFNAADGSELWHREMIGDLHGTMNRFGYSQSLLVDDRFVYCQPGGADTNMVALDRNDGTLFWFNAGKGEISAYCSPRIIDHNGQKLLLTFSEHHLLAFDPAIGELLWSVEQDTTCDIHGNTPIYYNGCVYSSSGCGSMTLKLELSDDGRAVKQIWRNDNLDNTLGGVLTVGNSLIGTGHRKRFLKRVDMESGICTDSVNTGRGCMIAADGMLYLYNEQGLVQLISVSTDSLSVVSSFKITLGENEHFAHPAIGQGKLFIRHGDVLMAYGIRDEQGS